MKVERSLSTDWGYTHPHRRGLDHYTTADSIAALDALSLHVLISVLSGSAFFCPITSKYKASDGKEDMKTLIN